MYLPRECFIYKIPHGYGRVVFFSFVNMIVIIYACGQVIHIPQSCYTDTGQEVWLP